MGNKPEWEMKYEQEKALKTAALEKVYDWCEKLAIVLGPGWSAHKYLDQDGQWLQHMGVRLKHTTEAYLIVQYTRKDDRLALTCGWPQDPDTSVSFRPSHASDFSMGMTAQTSVTSAAKRLSKVLPEYFAAWYTQKTLMIKDREDHKKLEDFANKLVKDFSSGARISGHRHRDVDVWLPGHQTGKLNLTQSEAGPLADVEFRNLNPDQLYAALKAVVEHASTCPKWQDREECECIYCTRESKRLGPCTWLADVWQGHGHATVEIIATTVAEARSQTLALLESNSPSVQWKGQPDPLQKPFVLEVKRAG